MSGFAGSLLRSSRSSRQRSPSAAILPSLFPTSCSIRSWLLSSLHRGHASARCRIHHASAASFSARRRTRRVAASLAVRPAPSRSSFSSVATQPAAESATEWVSAPLPYANPTPTISLKPSGPPLPATTSVSQSPSSPLSLAAIAQLSLPVLRGLLRYPVRSVSRLFAIVGRLRSAFAADLSGSDYRLILHHLALHHAASAAQQQEICALLLQVWDEYAGRQEQSEQDRAADASNSRAGEQWRREERTVMLDVLSACSRAGEGAACEHLVLEMLRRGLQLGVDELNAVLYGWRGDEQRMWRWLHCMQTLSRRLEAADSAPPDPQHSELYDALLQSDAVASFSVSSYSSLLLAPNADSLLILLHASAQADRFLRFELLLTRGFPLADFHLVPAAASTSLVMNQLLSFVVALSRTAPRVSLADRVAALQRLASELQYTLPVPLTPETVRATPRVLSLYRWSQLLGAELTSASLQEIISRQRTELVRGKVRLLVPSPTLQMLSLRKQKAEAQSRETQKLSAEKAESEEQRASHARPWQEVLAAYEHRVLSGQRVSLSESLTAIQACYRGRHWQRAVQLLVLPQWAEGLLERYDADEPQRSEEAQRQHEREAEEQHIALSPVTGCWTGPQHHRLSFTDMCRQEHWRQPQPGLELRLPGCDTRSPAVREQSPSASLLVTAAAAAVSSSSASPSPSPTSSVLHYAFCIAAMDAAGNAESVAKADALHCIALRQFPFLLHLYDPQRRCLHLHHPQLTTQASASDSARALDAFVQAEEQRGDKLWSLLYLVWRLQRRCWGGAGGEGEESPQLPELRILMRSYSEGGGRGGISSRLMHSRDADAADALVPSHPHQHLLLRVNSVADAAAVNGVLRLQPWAVEEAGWSQQWKWRQLAAVTPSSSQRRAGTRDRRAAYSTQQESSRWQQGYRDMYGREAADSSSGCFITRLQVKAWLQALHTQD